MFSKILAAIDIERETGAEKVVRVAEHFAKKQGATLHFVSVQPDDSEYNSFEFEDALADYVMAVNQRIGIDAGWTSVMDEDVDEGLATTVERLKPDLVIIGAHEPRWIDWFTGPTVRDFVARCEASLLIAY